MRRKIFIVDDHPIMREGYAALINREPDLVVCGEAGGALEALERIPEAAPDLVIADISMEGMGGLELIQRLTTQQPSLPVLVVSMHDEKLYGERALRTGARGYVMKSEVNTVVIEAIRHILHGGFYVSDQMSTQILLQYTGHRLDEEQYPIERLSDRELEVFIRMGQGLSTREIAETLHISPKTVESHRRRIKIKLAIDSTAMLLQRAVQWVQKEGLI